MRTFYQTVAASSVSAVVASLLFLWLAHAVMSGSLAWLDVSVRGAIHSWSNPTLTVCMEGVTELGSFYVLGGLGLFASWRLAQRGRQRAALILVISALGAEAFDRLLKDFFRRPRPDAFFGHLPASYSFPSGHSVESCCFYGVLAAIVAANARSNARRIGVWVFASVTTLAVGCSRIYLGVHYPTDV